MGRDTTWVNPDGLSVGFGSHDQDTGMLTKVGSGNGIDTYKMDIVGVDLVDTIALTDIAPQASYIPKGAYIKSAVLHVSEAFTSAGAATLDLGLFGTAVVDDADGIDVDIAITAIDAIGDVVLCNGAVVGALIPAGRTAGTDVTATASYETAVFTAGKASLIVEVIAPQGQAGRTLAV